MIEKNYHATEMVLDKLMPRLKEAGVEVKHLQSKNVNNPNDEVRSEDVYLTDAIAMRIKLVCGKSALSVNDDVYLSLIGKEENMGKVEAIVKTCFEKI